MKKFLLSLVLISVGSFLWWGIARTARFSIKKWDAKFESVIRHALTDIGLTNQDLLSSVHQIRKDKRGEWVVHQMRLKGLDAKKYEDLKSFLEQSGAQIEELSDEKGPLLLVKRGRRVYQEIRYTKS